MYKINMMIEEIQIFFNFWIRIILFVLLGFVIVACSPTSVPEFTQTSSTPKITQTPQFSTVTFPSTTVIPSTSTATQISTIEVTSTLAPETIAELATVEAIVAEIPELAQFYSRYCITEGYCGWAPGLGLSPNKEWAVFFISGKGSGGLSIINVDSKKQLEIFCSDITDDPIGGECTVVIEHWSRDGSYLYISPRRSGGDGGMDWIWREYIQLIRVNLKNETWVDTKMGTSYSFSPNDRFIVYRLGQNIVIHEFLTGQEKKFTVPSEYISFGQFVWSPDSNQIVFIASKVQEVLSYEGRPKGFSLYLMDIEDMKVQAILDNDKRYLYPTDWQTPTTVLLDSLFKLSPRGYLENGDQTYMLDLKTYQLSEYTVP